MPAPKGNNYWKERWKHGRSVKITPEKVLELFFEYMEHIESHPLVRTQVIAHQGEGYDHPVSCMRAGTIEGFSVYMGISSRTYREYRHREEFAPVIEWIDDALRERKLEGAAAGLLNANIVARDLGLREHQDVTSGDQPIGKIEIEYV